MSEEFEELKDSMCYIAFECLNPDKEGECVYWKESDAHPYCKYYGIRNGRCESAVAKVNKLVLGLKRFKIDLKA